MHHSFHPSYQTDLLLLFLDFGSFRSLIINSTGKSTILNEQDGYSRLSWASLGSKSVILEIKSTCPSGLFLWSFNRVQKIIETDASGSSNERAPFWQKRWYWFLSFRCRRNVSGRIVLNLQIVQKYCLLSCVIICFVKWHFLVNSWSQMLHLKGFSPVWIRVCNSILLLLWKLALQ